MIFALTIGSLCVDEAQYQINISIGVMSTGSNGRPFLVLALHFSNLYICLQQVHICRWTRLLCFQETHFNIKMTAMLGMIASSHLRPVKQRTQQSQDGKLRRSLDQTFNEGEPRPNDCVHLWKGDIFAA